MNFEITTRTKVLIGVLCVVTSFAIGRYSARTTSASTDSRSTEVKQTEEKKQTHTKTTKVETKKPDGSDTITTTTDTTIGDSIQQKETDKNQTTVRPGKTSILNISVLGANDFSRGLLVPTYGLSVTKEVLGPITVGAFGLMNGVVGVSIGLDF